LVETPFRNDAAECLREGGFWSEALALETPGLLDWASETLEKGRTLTALCSQYPRRWEAYGPPVFHAQNLGALGAEPRYLGVVGSRTAPSQALQFARDVGIEASRLGFVVVSGGAQGCDLAAISQASASLEILPHGQFPEPCPHLCRLSARALHERFTVEGAMERNALIYGCGPHTVIAHAIHKKGGTWAGCADALRRRLSRLVVRDSPSDLGLRSLIALGGIPLHDPTLLADALSKPEIQMRLPV
jgi:predicted Rossmann fold nucleotide-binding protein DprA/Smf involved in DNA uptake